jgi:hypothetical protein
LDTKSILAYILNTLSKKRYQSHDYLRFFELAALVSVAILQISRDMNPIIQSFPNYSQAVPYFNAASHPPTQNKHVVGICILGKKSQKTRSCCMRVVQKKPIQDFLWVKE